MSYAVLHPRSNTNPTDKYQVVDFDAWVRYIQNGLTGTLEIQASFTASADAFGRRDELNGIVRDSANR